eukprot:g19219.t1
MLYQVCMISKSFKLLRDMIAYVQDRGLDACLISLDQEKAFDKISHVTNYLSAENMVQRDWACTKSWEEHNAKTRQILVLWEHWSLFIAGKNQVI